MNLKIKGKKGIIFCVVLWVSMIFVPLLAISTGKGLRNNFEEEIETRKFEEPEGKYFCVFDESVNKVIKIPDKEFIYGTVAVEMPASFEEEALKAQAVASYTYFSREREEFRKKNSEGQAEVTINSEKWKYYVTKEQMKLKWGSRFEENYKKIKSAVDSVFGEVLQEDGNLILAAYHAMSSGITEKSKDVFGGDLKYLTNVPSPGDKQVQNYETTAEFTAEQFKEILEKVWDDCKFTNNPTEWIGNLERTEGGMVKSIEICSHRTNGREIRTMFSLRSADFDINFADGKFIFKVRGYGHGVGMSQYGAEFMAKQGSDYKQILAWYYPNTVLKNISGKK